MNVFFGPAGSAGLGNEEGIRHTAELKLGAYEVEFTYGVKMFPLVAKQLGELIKKFSLKASVHAPYYVNLCSEEKSKIANSKKRILESCERGSLLNAKYIIFHSAYYGKFSPEEAFEKVKESILDLQKEIRQRKWNVILAPETTGKSSQFGTVDELLKLKKETGCHLCVDFAHLYARNNGKIDYDEIFKKLKQLDELHCHFSGITYTPKGEKAHIPLTKEFFMPLANAIKKHKPKNIVIINESPNIFEDAVKMQKWFYG